MHGIAIQPPYNTLWKRAVRQTPVRSFTFRCQSLTKMKSLCRGHCICLSISIWTVATQITFSSRTSQGRFKWTNSLWSTGAPRSKTHSTMIFKKFSRIFSFLWMTARTGCWKGSKVRPFARFGDKTLRFSATSTAPDWSINFWQTMGSFTHGHCTVILFSSWHLLRVYKLTNIQLGYETIHNDVLAKDRRQPMFIPALRHFLTIILCEKRQPLQKSTDSRLDIKVNPQRQSLKAILAFQRTLHSGNPRHRKIRLSRHHQKERHGERLSQKDLW